MKRKEGMKRISPIVKSRTFPPKGFTRKPKSTKYPIQHLIAAFDNIQTYLVETSEGPALYDLRRILRELNIAIAEIRFENEKKI